MSYQVLARKWRPQTFLEMAGQDHVLQALVNALRQQRLHHAYLFTGTRGVGKTTIARIFAKCLNCEVNGISPEPCGECDSCREITEGRFVDLIEVDAASRTKVEDTRELLENVQYAPTRGRFKVYLIDEVHMLSSHSFNALLKTLEEPPEHVKFLLATTDPQKLPVTILSRCLQFNLKNMSAQRVVDYLQTVLGSEQVSYDQPALWQIGQAANGSMRDALSLTDQAIAFGDGKITETGVTSMLGLVNQTQILSLLESVAAKDAAQTLTKIEALADYQPDFISICGALLDALHRVAVEQQVPGVLQDQMGDLTRIQQLAQNVSPEEIQVMYQSLLIGRRDLPLSHSIKSGFEMLMLRLIAFRPATQMTVRYEAPSEPVAPYREPEPTVEQKKTAELNRATTVLPASDAALTPAETEYDQVDAAIAGPVETLAETPVPVAPAEPSLMNEQTPPWDESLSDDDNDYQAPVAEYAVPESLPSEPVVTDSKPLTVPAAPPQPKTSVDPSARLSKMLNDSNAAEEETDDEADERAIAETSDPFAMSASLVETVSDKPALIDKQPDTVAQPALAIPLPDIAHFKDMTMNLWWLVAPRLKLTGLVQNIIMNSCLMDASEQGVKLQVPLEYGHMLNQARYEQIQNQLSEFFAAPVPLIIDTLAEVEGVTAEEFAASKRAEALQAAINHLNAHPVVQALAETLGGQVLYDTVKVKA
ncbi:DNA polymerase III subunit gamma/tau [Marinomonas atlantica]|uniref:DNA polymerase III subunit gamma/tau n=1 Tax=Marinomonas atlantica TaxID=1806668 RepID=UPI00083412A3|nr:DNA polymerase III subunit gamma/tau [Marinomonas atlantica]MCO4785525.1 DNA polymerase III subunit gamma/tau [Marinomonas atlantica]